MVLVQIHLICALYCSIQVSGAWFISKLISFAPCVAVFRLETVKVKSDDSSNLEEVLEN